MVEPLGHNPQTQSITVALKNICRDYPAGGGVLRELLQNADDAGASRVRFVLDQTSYPTTTLVDQGAADYQGPSLLVYNDATFSDQDFTSLSRIGDSCKLQDGSTTGRFGRGFNAVYNWTDSPSIMSRDRLLILDPHHRWTNCYSNPGGPVYDFVGNAKGGAMRDQMAAFSAITEEFDRPFPGTIIRIPLRTPAQAKASQICGREASFPEVAQVLQTFADDFGHTGLLFMKSISRISIEVGDKPPINICICNDEEVKGHKSEINAAIKKTILEGVGNFIRSFEIEIKSGSPDTERQYRFAIHHRIQNYPENESLRSWSKDEALVPWVAVASEIGANAGETTSGSLFNVLPSQIHINQPVHIHSCFSMSPDRARLHEIGDSTMQYRLPGQWNHWLFDGLIPTAWTKLLVDLAKQYPNQSAFDTWPKPQEDTNNILYHIDEKVLRIVEQNNYSLWYTDLGYVTLGSGLVTKMENSSVMRKALNEAGVPVIYLNDDLFSSVEAICKVDHLRPQTLCIWLERRQERLRIVSEDTKQMLLDYVMSDPDFRGYGAVELFPFEDGIYRAIGDGAAFIHRDEDEHLLFQLEQSRNIERQKLSNSTLRVLQEGCSTSSLHSSLRYRSTGDLKTYCLQTHFKTFESTEDLIHVDENTSSFIPKAWDWIVTRQYSILDDNISCLWLIPLTDGRYRKIKPSDASFDTIYATKGELGDFLRTFANINAASNKPIIQAKDLSPQSVQLLTDAMTKDPSLFIKTSHSLEDFMLWLDKTREVFNVATDKDRWYLHELLASNLNLCKYPKTIAKILRGLKIFQSVIWKAENDHMVLHEAWITLNGYPCLVGLREIDPVPDVGEVIFLNATSGNTERLLSHFGLAKCPSTPELVKDFMIPFWEDKMLLRNWTTSGKEKVLESILRDFYYLDGDSQQQLSLSAIIPVARVNGERADKFSMAKELIDPSVEKLRELFFEDEEACPVDWVLEKYGGILIKCGLRTALDDDLVIERVKCFAQRSQEVEETSKRAKGLLQSVPSWKVGSDGREPLSLREFQWLPAIDPRGLPVLKTSKECRGLDEKLLVGLVLPVLNFEISRDWQNRLGWNHLIPHAILLAQLKLAIEQKNRKIVNAVLKYINYKGRIQDVRQELMKLSCVMASNERFVSVRKAFRTNCERLQPYFYNVERGFWLEHSPLLKKLGITEKPSLKDLLTVQDLLPSEVQLDENDIPIAIEIGKLAATFPRSQLSSLKILDETGRLRAIGDVTFHDLGLSEITGNFHSTHPDIPKSVIKALQIEPLSARVKKGELGISDAADDDEFDQREDVATGISDTLTRYTVESTFKEFLANADDCKDATQLNWLLDKRHHSKEKLLTEELWKFQGPALLVHNDGVFDDKDFEGFRRVGRGSKRDDASTIGKFGRGSQTMYHWTDVPMLLSGKYLVILDPLRQVLDLNYRTGRRKPGVKIELSKLKGSYRGQLVPFEGLWGFSQEADYYKGTIFRFPLRARTTQSKLIETGTPLNAEAVRICLDRFLEQEGRIALLFLRRIRFMDFRIYGDKEPRWSVHSDIEEGFSSGWVNCNITKCMNEKLDGLFRDRWWVAIQDPANIPKDLQYRHKMTMKDVECGIAALVPKPKDAQSPIFTHAPVPRYFSTLPLPFTTDLPVHIHTTFLLASDRASIPVEDSMRDAGAEWNRWLLSYAIPHFLLKFLSGLGVETIGLQDPFEFWPQESPPKRHLSEAVFTSFWQMLPNSSCQLFPAIQEIRAAQMGKRDLRNLVKINDAIFDLLPEDESVALRDILESQIPTLVRPTEKIRFELERIMAVESVTPKRLRKLFKQENASKCLEKAASEDPKVLETLLEIVKPVLDEDFKELDGCRILLLADGTLGTLRLADRPKHANHYFMANAEELKLFDFALGLLVGQKPGRAFKKAIMDSGKFNITLLDLSDIGTLFERQNFESKCPTKEMETWLGKFWDYYRRTETSRPDMKTPFRSSPGICCRPIFKATCYGIKTYIEPEMLDILPSVIEPDKPQQRSLCDKFPGIYVFSFDYLPTYLRTTETSFDTRASFTRFITTLSKLAKKEGMNLEMYIQNHLGLAEKKLVQKLVVKYVSADTSFKDHEMKNLLRSLPVWPTGESSTWISAAAALATGNSGLLVPWMREYQRFIEREALSTNLFILKALGVSEIPGINLLSTRILPNLPKELLDVRGYQSFIRAIPQISNWRNSLDTLRQSRLAPNRAGKLQTARELFDHRDAIFKSAFRNEQQDVFLLRELEEDRWFWKELGLKHRVDEQFKPNDYISCLTKMRNRLVACQDLTSDLGLVADVRVVLMPLTTPSTALGRFSNLDWSVVADRATFPAMTSLDNQSPHRREAMALVAAAIPLMQLSDIIASQHISICWSQTSFPAFEPTVTTLAKLPSQGKPPNAMVWRHIEHMANSMGGLAEDAVEAFLSDLYGTYDYLQDNLDDSRESFTAFQGSKVWFNLELTDRELVRKADLESCRCSIENLILESSCDTKNLKSVRQGLVRYQRLLKALGCKSIVYPTVEKTETRPNQLVSTSLSRLRREGTLLDVTLEAEGGNIQAHKVVIAAASAYFATQFDGNWSNNDSIDLKPFSYSTMSTLVDFAYADTFDWKSMQVLDDDNVEIIANKLDELLDLLVAANYFDMPDLKAEVENQVLIPAKLFIKEPNVKGVLERASEANAKRVEGYCMRFYAENKEAVDLANEE